MQCIPFHRTRLNITKLSPEFDWYFVENSIEMFVDDDGDDYGATDWQIGIFVERFSFNLRCESLSDNLLIEAYVKMLMLMSIETE